MKLKALLIAVGIAGLCSQAAMAQTTENGGRVTFTGTLKDTTCTTPGTINLNMGTIAMHDLTNMGDRTRPRDLTITLSNCNLGTIKTAEVNFTGVADAHDATLLANGTHAGAAKGVAIDLQDKTGKQVVNGTSAPYDLVDQAPNHLMFAATGVRTVAANSQDFAAGDISTFADFTITYK